MNKISLVFLSLVVIITTLFVSISVARAVTPTLSLSTANQTGDYVLVNVNGDPGASVFLWVGSSNSGFLGNLSSNGSGSFTVGSSASENQSFFGGSGISIASNSTIYVKVGGINGLASNQVTWPYINSSTSNGSLTLSQNGGLSASSLAVLLTTGQTSATITASANYITLLSNSNNQVANINLVYGSPTISIAAFSPGSTTAVICASGSTTNCATINVTVQNSSAQQLNFSQNNFSMVPGQNQTVTVTGGSGNYNQPQTSNSSIIQASVSGNVVTLTPESTTGAASITVCTTDALNCGIINVSVNALNSSSVTFSQTNPFVSISQSTQVTIFGGTGLGFYVSSNSNPSIIQPNITNNILTLIGNASTGTSTISICAVNGSCSSLSVTVGNATTGGALALSQSSVTILAGQSSSITISGGSAPYTFSAPNSTNIFNGVITGNILAIYAVNPGTGTASICSSAGCVNLTVTVNGSTSSTNPPTFSQNNLSLNVGQQTVVNISGTGNFYMANNTYANVATVTISGSSVTVTANSAGNSNISICQNGGLCATLYVTVGSNIFPTSTPTPTPEPTPSQNSTSYVFTKNLKYNDKGADVLALQKILVKLGYLTSTPTGHYGPATVTAVKKLQAAHKIKQLGSVGPATIAFLNQLKIIVK